MLSVVGPKAREKNIEVSSLLPEALPPLLADASRLEQVLMNLVTNTQSDAPEFGSVTIEGRPLSTGFVEVRVSDTRNHQSRGLRPHLRTLLTDR